MRLVRTLLAIAALGILVWQVIDMWSLVRAVASVPAVRSIPYNDVVQKAIDVIINQSTSGAQATVVLLGALAALWIAKGEDPQLAFRRGLWPEIAMWVAAVVMLGAALYCHKQYVDSIANALEAGGTTSEMSKSTSSIPKVDGATAKSMDPIKIPNVFDNKYEALRTAQFSLLLFGFIASVVAHLSVIHFSGGHDVGT